MDKRRSNLVAVAGLASAVALFLTFRIALLLKREPDLDEIFAIWISRKELGRMLQTLLLDSGPPLYYALLHAIHYLTPLSVSIARLFSLAVAGATMAVACIAAAHAARRQGTTPSIAAATPVALLLAVYPQHVFFSAEARAYALCALAVGAAVLCLDRWLDSEQLKWLIGGTAAVVLAAYVHYYGVLFFPLPFVLGLTTRNRRMMRDALAASAAAVLLFAPGFALAARQPQEAVAWMRVEGDLARVLLVAGSFLRIGFDARIEAGDELATGIVRSISVILLLFALWNMRRAPRALRYLATFVVPILGALVFAAAAKTAYFPIRFESILTVPVLLWFTSSLTAVSPPVRRTAFALAAIIGATASAIMITRYAPPATPERQIAKFIRQHANPTAPIVAGGLTYLEVYGLRDRSWQPPLIAFPSNYEVHPGHPASRRQIVGELPLLRAIDRPFLWAGDAQSEEGRALARSFGGRVIARNGTSVVVAVQPRK